AYLYVLLFLLLQTAFWCPPSLSQQSKILSSAPSSHRLVTAAVASARSRRPHYNLSRVVLLSRRRCSTALHPFSSPVPRRSTLLCSKIPLPHILLVLGIVNIRLPLASARHILAPSPSYTARSKTTQ
ncbi:hypothetical protein S245_004243, partial [Arachis hypogaea]